jgi:hypothetical protein
MITLVLATILAFALVNFMTMGYALKHAPDGFEDYLGFHPIVMKTVSETA